MIKVGKKIFQPGHKLEDYVGIHVIITDFFLDWANIFLEGRVSCRPGSDHAFYCDVFLFFAGVRIGKVWDVSDKFYLIIFFVQLVRQF